MKDRLICIRLSQEDYETIENAIKEEQEKALPAKIRKTDYYRDKLLYTNSHKELRLAVYILKKIQLELRHTNLLLQQNKFNTEAFQNELEGLFNALKNMEDLLKEGNEWPQQSLDISNKIKTPTSNDPSATS